MTYKAQHILGFYNYLQKSGQARKAIINMNNSKLDIPKIENMKSPRTGKPVANQYIIMQDNRRVFQSYRSIIAVIENDGNLGKVMLDKIHWDFSRTTGKYRNIFLGETKKETEAKIQSEEYILTDLN